MALNGLKQTLGAVATSRVLKVARLSWIGYGAAAYAGLRVMKHFKILEPQTDKALSVLENAASQLSGGLIKPRAQANKQQTQAQADAATAHA